MSDLKAGIVAPVRGEVPTEKVHTHPMEKGESHDQALREIVETAEEERMRLCHIGFEPIETRNKAEIEIWNQCIQLANMLVEKNRNYGNSALDPLRIFSKADAVEQLRVRIDDKLSRLMRGKDAGEDVILDLLGYLVLLRIAMKKETKQ